MPVKRINDLRIKERGLFTAIYGLVADEFFVEDDLKRYSLWQQLYVYLKREGFDRVLFYDHEHKFHSYSQLDIVRFLDPEYFQRSEAARARRGSYTAFHIASPFKTTRRRGQMPAEAPAAALLQSIRLNESQGKQHAFWRATVSEGILDYFKSFLSSKVQSTAIIIKYPDNAGFEYLDEYVTYFNSMNSVDKINGAHNKIIIVYRENNDTAFINNLQRGGRHLFVDGYFRSVFLESSRDEYRVSPKTTFYLGFPDEKEIRNWLNWKRIGESVELFGSVPFAKIIVRLLQERKSLADLQNLNLENYLGSITNRTAWDELNQQVGLTTFKARLREIVEFRKAANARGPENSFRPHLCFTGNPGTGKTTMARIAAQIFKEEGLLPIGHYKETTATQLIGDAVGVAATLMRQACMDARGGVLFIDEAYAFVNAGAGEFGEIAIAELIAWMEDPQWRKETVVIFAGYPDEMDKLFRTGNAGLKGRISQGNFLSFANYTAGELSRIFCLNASRHDIMVSAGAGQLLENIFSQAIKSSRGSKDWKNARYAEDVFSQVYQDVLKQRSDTIHIANIPLELVSLVKGQKVNDIRHSPDYLSLQKLTGLEEVKRFIEDLVESIQYDESRIESGEIDQRPDQSLHMIFTGPPGAGKTTVAKKFGGLLKDLGILVKGHLHSVTGKDLIAGVVGQSAKNTAHAIEKAMGGILFIDEAYGLAGGMKGDFGDAVITTLLDAMEDKRDQFVVIIAGYEMEINVLLAQNPGLKDRFNKPLRFPDLRGPELISVFTDLCKNAGLAAGDPYDNLLDQYFILVKERDKFNFANSRSVRVLLKRLTGKEKKG